MATFSDEEAKAGADLVSRLEVVATWHTSRQRNMVEAIACDLRALLGSEPHSNGTPATDTDHTIDLSDATVTSTQPEGFHP